MRKFRRLTRYFVGEQRLVQEFNFKEHAKVWMEIPIQTGRGACGQPAVLQVA